MSKEFNAAHSTPPHQIIPAVQKKRDGGPFSNWLLSLGCMIVVPCLPLFIEAAKHEGFIKPDTLYVTGAVLAASYGLGSLHNLFRFGYLCLFVGMIALDFQPEEGKQWLPKEWAFWLMVVVAATQAVERFTWHVAQNRLFPDWLEGD
jgi:hypothetical protein